MWPRRAPGVLVLLLATALTSAVATLAQAEETASPRAVWPIAETPSAVLPLSGAEGAGWMTAPAPTPVATSAAHVSIAHRWWFWASLGTAAVAVIIAGFALKPGQPYAGNAGPGVVTLQ